MYICPTFVVIRKEMNFSTAAQWKSGLIQMLHISTNAGDVWESNAVAVSLSVTPGG